MSTLWNDVDGNAVDDPVSFYGKDKMDEFCRRIFAKKRFHCVQYGFDLMARMGIC